MFTGLVETVGKVRDISKSNDANSATSIKISCDKILEDVEIGDSIAVNGTCLTVTEFDSTDRLWFKVGVSPESLRRTNLCDLSVNSDVNLERSMSGSRKFGGHFVQGHVDATCEILEITSEKESMWFKMNIPDGLSKFIVSKGYIALDGTSLTVCDVTSDTFNIMLVEYTQKHVIFPKKSVGDKVNIEVDIVGKYVEKCLQAQLDNNLVLREFVENIVRETMNKK